MSSTEIIDVRNVNEAWSIAVNLISRIGEERESRNGTVVVAPCPVVTIYDHPQERVLFDPVRDANPIFHLHESLWMLAGRDDARWLDQFVGDFSQRFGESDGHMHGAYGYRWRRHFYYDQLKKVIELLTFDPTDRQAVIQMWDSDEDLGVPGLKDRPCNTQIYLRADRGKLDMAITCRSNDIVWGCYGANAVHFSILQEYLAAMIKIPMGTMTQFSWNWHMYKATEHLVDRTAAWSNHMWMDYPHTSSLVTDRDTFDDEVKTYVRNPLSASLRPDRTDFFQIYHNRFFTRTAFPMWEANELRKKGDYQSALSAAKTIEAADWRQATVAWLERRMKK